MMGTFSINQRVCAWVLALPSFVVAATAGIDDASGSAYTSGWYNGTGGNTTFSNWTLNPSTGSTSTKGFFVGDSRQLAAGLSGANIDSSNGNSLGLYSHSGYASATRSINDSLSVGQSFSLDIAVNYRNGHKGVDLFAGNTQVFNLDVSSDNYFVNGTSFVSASNDNQYSANTSFRITFLQTSASGGDFNVVRSGGISQSFQGSFAGGLLSKFDLYVGDTDINTQDNFYANNFTVSDSNPTPELASTLLFSTGFAACALARRRNERRFLQTAELDRPTKK